MATHLCDICQTEKVQFNCVIFFFFIYFILFSWILLASPKHIVLALKGLRQYKFTQWSCNLEVRRHNKIWSAQYGKYICQYLKRGNMQAGRQAIRQMCPFFHIFFLRAGELTLMPSKPWLLAGGPVDSATIRLRCDEIEAQLLSTMQGNCFLRIRFYHRLLCWGAFSYLSSSET